MAKKGYLPKKDAELVPWGENFTAHVTEKASDWGIPYDEVVVLQALLNTYKVIHARADSPEKNAIIVAEKNTARKALVDKIQGLVDFRLRNPIITDGERVAMGLHIRDTTHTPIPVPSTHPKLTLQAVDYCRMRADFQDAGSTSKAKPYGVNGAVIIYAVLDTPPSGREALSRSVLATRTPHFFEFTLEERGKTVYMAICWQNEKGQKGPWSKMESTVIL
jgi:hypothetical protein